MYKLKRYLVTLQEHNYKNHKGNVIKAITVMARTKYEAKYEAIRQFGELYRRYSESGRPIYQLVITKEGEL